MRTIHWISLITGKCGHGNPLVDKDAISYMKAANIEWKGTLHHWTEEAPEQVIS